jgi:hypothetical protein
VARPARAAPLAAAAARVALLASLALAALPPSPRIARAQTPRRAAAAPRWRAELAAAVAGPLVKDGTGTTVTPRVAPAAGVAAAWDVAPRVAAVLRVRGSTSSLEIESDDGDWGGGRSWQLDAVASIEGEVFGCAAPRVVGCTVLHGGAGAAWLHGPRDVVPFRAGGATQRHWSGEVGASVRFRRALFGTATAQAYRLGGAAAGDPVKEPGSVRRLLVGVRYGR